MLLKFDGRQLHNYDELPPLVQQHQPGDKVKLELRRGSEILQLQVTLGKSAGNDQ